MSEDNVIADNYVYSGGTIFHSAVGIWVGESGHNLITRNEVFDFPYSGISVGWTWANGPVWEWSNKYFTVARKAARSNIISDNHVHHVGRLSVPDGRVSFMADLGGIYTLGYDQDLESCQGEADCCARNRRVARAAGLSAAAFAALGLGAWLLFRNGPATFHHICRFFPGS